MKKIYSLLAAMALCMSTFAANYTYYFGVPSGGTYTPYVWVASSNWTVLSNPEHTAMTFLGMNGTTSIYKYQITSDVEPHYLIFTIDNGWSNQSGDAIAVNGGYYQGGTYGCQSTNTTVSVIYASDNAALGLAPSVVLTSSAYDVLPGQLFTLTASAEHFSGTPISYAYSYSTDEGENWTLMPGSTASTTFTAGASGTVYRFKVVASHNEESAQSIITVHVVTCTAVGAIGIKDGDVVDDLFGLSWKPALADNDMTYNAGVFTLTKSGVYLPAGTIYYKVALNHSWDVSYPNDNMELILSKAGYYDITFSLTWDSKAVSATATYLYPAIVKLVGNFNNWDLNANPMAFDGTSLFSASKNLEIGQVPDTFKIVVIRGGETSWYGNNGQMDRVNHENWPFATGSSNCRLLKDISGVYTFSFAFASKEVSVEFPTSFVREAANDNFQTLCVPFNASVSNAEVYEVTSVDEDFVHLSAIDAAFLTAGKSYIVKPSDNMTITAVGAGVVSDPVQPAQQATGLYGNLGLDYVYNYAVESAKANPWVNNYILLSDGKFHKIEGTATATIRSTYAYLHVNAVNAAPEFRIAENATNIEGLDASENAVKFIKNGQLFIQKNGVVYNAVGAVVE